MFSCPSDSYCDKLIKIGKEMHDLYIKAIRSDEEYMKLNVEECALQKRKKELYNELGTVTPKLEHIKFRSYDIGNDIAKKIYEEYIAKQQEKELEQKKKDEDKYKNKIIEEYKKANESKEENLSLKENDAPIQKNIKRIKK